MHESLGAIRLSFTVFNDEFFFFFLFLNDRIVSTTQIFQIGSIIAWAVLQLQFICIQSFTINRNFN